MPPPVLPHLFLLLVLDQPLLSTSGSASCSCVSASLCAPLTTNPAREVFMFSSPGTPNEDVAPPDSESDWRSLPWDVMTTVALVGPMNMEMLCHAHERGVRVVFGWGMSGETILTLRGSGIWHAAWDCRCICSHQDSSPGLTLCFYTRSVLSRLDGGLDECHGRATRRVHPKL